MAGKKPLLSFECAREMFDYSPTTGVLTFRGTYRKYPVPGRPRRPFHSRPAGCVARRGYLVLAVDGRQYKVHRIIWLWMTGAWPTKAIDHVDGNCSNNAWTNLRQATPSQNNANSRLHSNNTTGYRGVNYVKQDGTFQATIMVHGTRLYLGRAKTAEGASVLYQAAFKEHFGDFARTR